MSINSNSIWNFAEKHPFLFYSCVSSIVGGTVKIVRTLKGEPKTMSVTVPEEIVEKITGSFSVKNPPKEADVLNFSEVVDAVEENEDDIPPEASAKFLAYEIPVEPLTDKVPYETFEDLKNIADKWGKVTLSDVMNRAVNVGESNKGSFRTDWGWTAEEFERDSELMGEVLILPPPHKLESCETE